MVTAVLATDPVFLLAVGAIFPAMQVARALMVYPISMVLGRDWPLVPVAFGVVLLSLLLQGLTIPALIRATGVGGASPDDGQAHERELQRGT